MYMIYFESKIALVYYMESKMQNIFMWINYYVPIILLLLPATLLMSSHYKKEMKYRKNKIVCTDMILVDKLLLKLSLQNLL